MKIGELRMVRDIVLGDGILDQFGQIIDIQFFHDIGTVPAHRIGADVQNFGDFFGPFAFRQEF
jgi:hypothetical protein